MNIQQYLKRIKYQGKVDKSLGTLIELQKTHLKSVPFENLDIHYGKKIHLNFNAFYDKIVNNNRGGFCYELNGLFYQLLSKIGFQVKLVSARVHTKNDEYGNDFDHMAIIATVDKQDYLVDVGFGKFSFAPLPIIYGETLEDEHGLFQFDHYSQKVIRVSEMVDGKLVPQYIFEIKPRKLKDFQEMCTFHQTSKDSHFTHGKVISLPTANGRITLSSDHLKITTGDSLYETHFYEEKFEEFLAKHFGIEIPEDNVYAR